MADDRSRKLTGTVPPDGAGPPSSPAHPVRDPRSAVVVPVRLRYQSFIEFIETQSMNISRSGMFVSSTDPLPVGTPLEFELALADGFPLLRGTGEVARISASPPGLGIRFRDLDDASRKLIDRILQINAQEGKQPTVSLEFSDPAAAAAAAQLRGATKISAGIEFSGRDLRIQVNPGTVGYFTNNPLLNIRLGGFVVPGPTDVPLGAVYTVTIGDMSGTILWSGKGKVVAKHEQRLGIRLSDVPKPVLATLQAEVTRAAPR